MIILSSILLIIIAVWLLAIITDEYFIVSLDRISKRLKIPGNVAGASLMAMGSSAPELAIALLALFIAGGEHADVGIGAIVGSAIFNILVITGVSAIVRPVIITWRVLVRDVVMYVISVALLIAAFADGTVAIWEAAVFLLLYGLYIVVLFNWEAFAPDQQDGAIERVGADIEAQTRRTGPYFVVTTFVSRIIGLLTGDPEKSYWRTFLVSIALIALLSYLLVENAILFAEAINVPPVIVALTVVAAGTSVPDMFASIVVARQGRGDMAIANAVGSNVFDILIGLGFPWLLAILVQGHDLEVGAADLFASAVVLLGTVILLFIFLTTGRRLSRAEGIVLVLVYLSYVIWVWFG